MRSIAAKGFMVGYMYKESADNIPGRRPDPAADMGLDPDTAGAVNRTMSGISRLTDTVKGLWPGAAIGGTVGAAAGAGLGMTAKDPKKRLKRALTLAFAAGLPAGAVAGLITQLGIKPGFKEFGRQVAAPINEIKQVADDAAAKPT